MATLKQTIANRINSLKSTGPCTARGREKSSRNATKHGLSRLGAIPPSEMAVAIVDRIRNWRDAYRPEGPAQRWHFERLCGESVRLDSCEHRLIVARAEDAARAAESWDDDRAAEVATLAAKLPDHPEFIQPRLLTSRHGVLWMLERWDVVAESLRRHDGWTIENWFVALDLLGVPVEGRRHSGPWDLDPEDKTAAPGLELVRQGVEALRSRLEGSLDARDARHREDAEAGLNPVESPEIRRLERYASDARRQVARNLAELRRLQAEAPAPDAGRAERPPLVPPPRPSRASSPRPTPTAPPPNAPAEPAPTACRPEATAPTATAASASQPGRSLAASLRDRLAPAATAGNRRTRRAQAALARRS